VQVRGLRLHEIRGEVGVVARCLGRGELDPRDPLPAALLQLQGLEQPEQEEHRDDREDDEQDHRGATAAPAAAAAGEAAPSPAAAASATAAEARAAAARRGDRVGRQQQPGEHGDPEGGEEAGHLFVDYRVFGGAAG
jgi:hypothetical protein